MIRKAFWGAVVTAAWVVACANGWSQTTSPAAPATATSTGASAAVSGGTLRGHVKSGTVPLPGVTVTAQNTLTGKRYSTTTDVTGAWALMIPANGRYVIRTQFAAFAPGAQESVLNASSREQILDFQLVLASRAAQQQQREDAQTGQVTQAIRQMAANGAQSLNLISALTGDAEAQGGTGGASGTALPSIAGNSDFSEQSVAISGQSGSVSPLAGVDMDRLRDAMETFRAQGGFGGGDGPAGGLFGGGSFGGGAGGFGGGFGGGGGGGRGHGSAARCNGDVARAGRVWRARWAGRRTVWRRRIWGTGRFRWWRIWRWRWKTRRVWRDAEFPELQTRAAAWSHLLDGQ